VKIVVGSRGSALALTQTRWVISALQQRCPQHQFELSIIKTSGDIAASLMPSGESAKGLFVKELEEALLVGTIHLAVHSIKDLPTGQPAGLRVAAVPVREDARDVLIAPRVGTVAKLLSGAVIGTSSPRRRVQFLALRPDLVFQDIKGNVDTRLAKADRGEYEAIVLAAAGLNRLGMGSRVTEMFSIQDMVPAPGQGALGLEIRDGEREIEEIVRPLDDSSTHIAVLAERACLAALGGGCREPIGAYAEIKGSRLVMVGMKAEENGSSLVKKTVEGEVDDPLGTGRRLAAVLLGVNGV